MKRKTYHHKVDNLLREAKAETLALMKEKGVRELDITRHGVTVFAENIAGGYMDYPVTKVSIAEGANGAEVLEWDFDGPGHWYANPLLWIDIHRAVFCELNEWSKRFEPGW